MAAGTPKAKTAASAPADASAMTANTQAGERDASMSKAGQEFAAQQEIPSPVPLSSYPIFGLKGPVTMAEIPEGRFKQELSRLSEAARNRTLENLARIRRVPRNNVESLTVDNAGNLIYECLPPDQENAAVPALVAEATILAADIAPLRSTRSVTAGRVRPRSSTSISTATLSPVRLAIWRRARRVRRVTAPP